MDSKKRPWLMPRAFSLYLNGYGYGFVAGSVHRRTRPNRAETQRRNAKYIHAYPIQYEAVSG